MISSKPANGSSFDCASVGNATRNVRNVTRRKPRDETLRESEEKLRLMFDSIAEGVAVTDLSGNIQDLNEAEVRLHGYQSKQELIGRSAFDLIAQKDHARARENMERTLNESSVRNVEYTLLRKDGREFPAELSAAVFKGTDGNPQGFIAVTKDISGRKRAEQALRKSEAKYRCLVERSRSGIGSIDLQGRLTFVNRGLCEMIGYSEDEIVGRPFVDFLHPDDRENVLRLFQQGSVSPRKAVYTEFRIIHKSGHIVHLGASPTAINYENELVGFNSIINDITERKHAEERQLAYQKELRSLASRLSLAEERERRRISMEVHDRISQTLAICRIKLDALLESAPLPPTNGCLREIQAFICQLIDETRSLTFELSSPLLYEFGLEAALERLTEQTQERHGISCHFEDDGRPKPLDDDIRVLLFQTVRELLLNVVKHARAQNIEVHVRRYARKIRIVVEDDGIGFDTRGVISRRKTTKGFGLVSVQERLHYIGGQIEFESERNHGTRVTMEAPLRQRKNDHAQEV